VGHQTYLGSIVLNNLNCERQASTLYFCFGWIYIVN
jgi:hypothetical protein